MFVFIPFYAKNTRQRYNFLVYAASFEHFFFNRIEFEFCTVLS